MSDTITISSKIDNRAKKEIQKFMGILNFDSSYWFVKIGMFMCLNRLDGMLKKCENNTDLFKNIFLNPEKYSFSNAREYFELFSIIDVLPELEKKKFFLYLERRKLNERRLEK